MGNPKQDGIHPFVILCSAVASTGTFNAGTGLPQYTSRLMISSALIIFTVITSGFATGMTAFDGLLGAILASPMAEKMGRQDAIVATTSTVFIIERVFVGIDSGSMSVLVSMYIAEIVPPKQRGMLVGLLQLFAACEMIAIKVGYLGL
ncbi:hypothetical protein BDA99DRAFT_554070 [Phascolomyces articulosus]|uniref:Major facilitator superfamily (MFS) profile domain-containing protein n=1 Tax=Phascolomyces articulosus TaxID=60185 RepID=A0AAD5KCH2_9FUNG|nr:hypothetical protein BDA99DRAFT_554070 [Phascolomyces articulosus]